MENGSHFNKQKTKDRIITILLIIVGVQFVFNAFIAKGYINVAENKEIKIQIPQFLEAGEYIIGNTYASDNTYRAWARLWTQDIANFSYQNIREKYQNIYPFLDKDTVRESKSDLLRFIDFVEENSITQSFDISADIKIKQLPGQYKKITVYGTIHRKIGSTHDQLNGMRYAYEYVTYVRSGQIFIKTIKTSFYSLSDKRQRDQLKENSFVNFEDNIQ